ncbi:MAG: dipeptidase [Ignavibacteria bacterium]|nr:dipeptidase [Ignavibacteria bacterium]MBT8380869.1 dipeptidase [Ignavibacteria bacterium]MBT8391144.1 dipeptidase [Ignavibacteria bacterium]
MDKITNYINSRKEEYIEELKDFLKIPSISTLADHKKDMQKAADFVAAKLKKAGIENVKLIKTKGHSLVYGDWLHAKDKPTVLIYGHYDVQPVDPLHLWDSPPFEPVIKGNKIYARGATDDKGQMYVHIKSVEAYFKTVGKLPVNVKFLIEGEEEIGSHSLEEFVNKNGNFLKCDTVLLSDTSLFGTGIPTLTYGLRGLSYLQIEVTGPDRDLHSGTFGGAVDNPINVLAEMIAKLRNKDSKILIPGFYDDVIKLTKKERNNFKALPFSAKKFAGNIGVSQLKGEKGYTTFEHTWARPSLDCNGVLGGFTGDGAKTVLPSKAMAKVSMRIVPNQNPKKIAKLFKEYIKKIAPKTVKVEIKDLHGAYPIVSPLDAKPTVSAAEALSKVFGKKTVFMREGGSIPIVVVFSQKLKVPVVMMGLGLDTENLHSPNEHFNLKHFHLGILSSAYFFETYSK